MDTTVTTTATATATAGNAPRRGSMSGRVCLERRRMHLTRGCVTRGMLSLPYMY